MCEFLIPGPSHMDRVPLEQEACMPHRRVLARRTRLTVKTYVDQTSQRDRRTRTSSVERRGSLSVTVHTGHGRLTTRHGISSPSLLHIITAEQYMSVLLRSNDALHVIKHATHAYSIQHQQQEMEPYWSVLGLIIANSICVVSVQFTSSPVAISGRYQITSSSVAISGRCIRLHQVQWLSVDVVSLRQVQWLSVGDIRLHQVQWLSACVISLITSSPVAFIMSGSVWHTLRAVCNSYRPISLVS